MQRMKSGFVVLEKEIEHGLPSAVKIYANAADEKRICFLEEIERGLPSAVQIYTKCGG
jgi:hypothetical protein